MTAYKVWVLTSDMQYAGTDANVFIQIYGSNADTGKFILLQTTFITFIKDSLTIYVTPGKIHLKTSTLNKKPFERGATDLFEFKAMELDRIKKIRFAIFFKPNTHIVKF
jgi:hypothetical protein